MNFSLDSQRESWLLVQKVTRGNCHAWLLFLKGTENLKTSRGAGQAEVLMSFQPLPLVAWPGPTCFPQQPCPWGVSASPLACIPSHCQSTYSRISIRPLCRLPCPLQTHDVPRGPRWGSCLYPLISNTAEMDSSASCRQCQLTSPLSAAAPPPKAVVLPAATL